MDRADTKHSPKQQQRMPKMVFGGDDRSHEHFFYNQTTSI
jgi:hypothetical protein